MTFLKDFLALNSSDIFYENWWINVSEILELGKGESWPDRLVEFIFWVISIAITGVVVDSCLLRFPYSKNLVEVKALSLIPITYLF